MTTQDVAQAQCPMASGRSSIEGERLKTKMRQYHELPSLPIWPVIGSSPYFRGKPFHEALHHWTYKYGSLYRFRLGFSDWLVVSDAVDIEAILRTRPSWPKMTQFSRVCDELADSGVFTAEGDEWLRQRKLVTRTFTPELIRKAFPGLLLTVQRLRGRWDKQIALGQPVDIQRDLKAATLDISFAFALGEDVNTLENNTSELQVDIETIFTRMGDRLKAVIPYWRFLRLPIDREADAASVRITRALTELIARARKRMADQPELRLRPSSMLEAMVAASDEPGSDIDDRAIIGNAIANIFAGEDTSSSTLAWALNQISEDKRVAEIIAEETARTFGSVPHVPSFESLESLAYTEATVHEIMRWVPVVPIIARETPGEVVIRDTIVPKGIQLVLLSRHATMDASNIPKPTEFSPERWLDTELHDPNRKLFPFGGGARFCPGRYLALIQIKTILSMIVHNYNLVRIEGADPVTEVYTITMSPSAVPIRLEKRHSVA